MGRPNLSREETKFSGGDGDGEKAHFSCSADHKQEVYTFTR